MITTKKHALFVSDTAETLGDGKTYNGIEKVIPLSKRHSAGMMINGNLEFEDTPVNVLSKEYREYTDFEKIDTICEIKNRLLDYFAENTKTTKKENYIKKELGYFKEELKEDIKENGFTKTVKTRNKIKVKTFLKSYKNFDSEFDDIIPQDKNKKYYTKRLWEIFSYELQFEGTEIIILGYDIQHHYPTFYEFNIYCNDNGKVLYEMIDYRENSNKAYCKFFAINDEAYTFITGVNEEFIDFIIDYIEKRNDFIVTIIQSEIKYENIENVDKIMDIIKNVLYKEYSNIKEDIKEFRIDCIKDTSSSLEYLPEWLLCLFADHLVKLTALKQKTSSEIESVSYPTKILLFEKSEGFRWVNLDDRIL